MYLSVIACLILMAPTPVASALFSSTAGNMSGIEKHMEPEEVQETMVIALHQNLAVGHGNQAGGFKDIGRKSLATWRSLSKNVHGRVESPALRYAANHFLQKEHGWHVRGLEAGRAPSQFDKTVDMTTNIPPLSSDSMPDYVEFIMGRNGTQGNTKGYRLAEVVAMVGVIRNLIQNEGMARLANAYELNGRLFGDRLTYEGLAAVLDSYMVLFAIGSHKALSQAQYADGLATSQQNPDTQMFVRDTVRNIVYEETSDGNPFEDPSLSWESAAQAMFTLNRDLGKFRSLECEHLKEGLAQLDPKGTGRVPIGRFYSKKQVGRWQLTESVEYLRQLGALDETLPGNIPHVVIPNYIASMSNCENPSAFYSVCCISECEDLQNSIEKQVRKPYASPEMILGIVQNLSSTTVDAPRNLSTALVQKLQAVAEMHSGNVPLHSRLFEQWLHFSFPLECPYPYMTGALSSSKWLGETSASADEVRQYTQLHSKDVEAHDQEMHMSQWTLDEEMTAGGLAPLRPEQAKGYSVVVFKIVLFLATAIAACREGRRMVSGVLFDQPGSLKKGRDSTEKSATV